MKFLNEIIKKEKALSSIDEFQFVMHPTTHFWLCQEFFNGENVKRYNQIELKSCSITPADVILFMPKEHIEEVVKAQDKFTERLDQKIRQNNFQNLESEY